jgi:hypothetical protein
MKKLLLLSGLMVAALGAYAQGTVNFANGASGVDAPITNGIPGSPTPSVRADNTFRAQLYVGPAGTANQALLSTNGVSGTPATLLSGGGAGYFLGNARDITGFAPGSVVTLQVRAWSTSGGATSWESATGLFRGESNLIQTGLGGGTIPTPNMLGLQGFVVGIPEPSSIALGLLGLGAIVLFRRRK